MPNAKKWRIRRNSASNTSPAGGSADFISFPSAPSTWSDRSRGRTSSGRAVSTITSQLDHDADYLAADFNHQPLHIVDLFAPPPPKPKRNRAASLSTTTSITSDPPQVFSSDHDEGVDDSSETEMEDDVCGDDGLSRMYQPVKLYPSPVRIEHADSQETVHEFEDLRALESSPGSIAAPKPMPRPLTYSSLPATPVSTSPPPLSESFQSDFLLSQPPFSLWDYLREELLATDFDSHQEMKWERVSNFLNIPFAIEKIIGFGFILCLDSFLYTFTILPIRFLLAFWRLVRSVCSLSPSPALPPAQKADILRMLLLVVSIVILAPLTDASKIYHSIRGQDTIKLYVIFNALEIADRLCASIGQDILDCLFSRSTLLYLSHRQPMCSQTVRPFVFFVLGVIYTVAHTLVMVYQTISLNVAVNSYDHALLTLLVSNQFVEIKGSVFKKFEKDNLFQITCADIVERFTLSLMLIIVAFRNLIELSGSEFNFSEGFSLPKSFGWFRGNNGLWTIFYPVFTVMISEMLVDWLKHAFITKFNHIRPSVYERYTDVLCRDLASGSAAGRRGARKHTYVDQSPLVARRLGFASLPLAVLAMLIGSQSINLLISMHESEFEGRSLALSSERIVMWLKWGTLGVAFWSCFVVVKIIIGVRLLSYATTRRSGMKRREAEDAVNDFCRDPIGEGNEEKMYNKELKMYLDNKGDNAKPVAEIGERRRSGGGGGGGGAENRRGGAQDQSGGKKRLALEDITRFTMVKRIW